MDLRHKSLHCKQRFSAGTWDSEKGFSIGSHTEWSQAETGAYEAVTPVPILLESLNK